MAGVSIRKFIRWLPGEASEPTSTLVLTSPERRYVDLRVLLPGTGDGTLDEREARALLPPHRPASLIRLIELLPPERLDWAIAGTCSSCARPDGSTHSRWRHWIDSRAKDAEAASDEGDMYPQRPDSLTTLERGRMVDPATGEETAYEELWYDPVLDKGALCAVLRMEDESAERRGLFVRLGAYAQALVREGDEVVAERWEWTEGDGDGDGDGEGGTWRRRLRVGVGRTEMPCEKVLRGQAVLRRGDVVNVGDDEVWEVVEMAEL